jgi:hypothetical protein
MTLVDEEWKSWFNLRPGGATRGKESIIKWEGWIVDNKIFGAPRW